MDRSFSLFRPRLPACRESEVGASGAQLQPETKLRSRQFVKIVRDGSDLSGFVVPPENCTLQCRGIMGHRQQNQQVAPAIRTDRNGVTWKSVGVQAGLICFPVNTAAGSYEASSV